MNEEGKQKEEACLDECVGKVQCQRMWTRGQKVLGLWL